MYCHDHWKTKNQKTPEKEHKHTKPKTHNHWSTLINDIIHTLFTMSLVESNAAFTQRCSELIEVGILEMPWQPRISIPSARWLLR